MAKPTDIQAIGASVWFLPVVNRIPLKFGAETVTSVTCARVRVRLRDRAGRTAEGWGETPLSVSWVWPSAMTYESRHEVLKDFVEKIAAAWSSFASVGHAFEVGHDFIEHRLPELWRAHNSARRAEEAMPWLAALVCCSAFDIATHDGFGLLVQRPVYETYDSAHLNRDLSAFLQPEAGTGAPFEGKYPADFFQRPVPRRLPAWHLVGGKDAVTRAELSGQEPNDGYPVLLADWIRRDGLRCLKVKLVGNDAAWDYARIVAVGRIAVEGGVDWLSADFNCTVREPEYVNAILDRLLREEPRLYGMILYVEQPFPYDLEANRIDVRSVSARKPLFMDESAHDWTLVRLGRQLGWSGVALKTCKTQTGALLSLCWAKAHGMTLMVQDLTNPMLAQIPHVQLAAHAGTIMGVETNAMQFYPEASRLEAEVHPGLYARRGGEVNWSTVTADGFGYRLEAIQRRLPAPDFDAG